MSLSQEGASHDVVLEKVMETDSAAKGAKEAGKHSAPSSPCVARKVPQTLNLDSSKIPQPLASPTPLRRSGSLRLRGEKLGFAHPRTPSKTSGRGGLGPGARTPGVGAAFPSITEAAESWKKSLRGSGDGPTSLGLPSPPINNSNLRQLRHHRSLQSLSSRNGSKDPYHTYHTPTPSPEDFELRPHNLNRFLLDHANEFNGHQDDLDSVRSYGSNCSTQSACDHAQFARNGTTFSGRRMKYIVHCSSHPEPNEYLTPTQRANQQIRRLKALVEQARQDIEAKDENIFKLTKEVVELRLLREEVDGSTPKSTKNCEESPVCKVVAQLENEYGNSTSLSDSGHFDDVLSLASPQSTLSPGPRQLIPSPDTERQAEIYQRKIEDITKKQGEKSLVDRKNLVEMYEKKMEDMCRRSSEKFREERNDLIEMYEKKIGNIVQSHREKIQAEKLLLEESYERKLEELTQKFKNQESTNQDNSGQVFSKELEESQQMLEMAENRASSLSLQLDDINARLSDLQQELFQSRERTVLLEEEVETLQKTVASQEQQLTEKSIELVQAAQLESELQLLRRHLEEQKESLETKSHLEGELSQIMCRFQEEEQKKKMLEQEKMELECLFKKKEAEADQLRSQFKDELSIRDKRINELEEQNDKLEYEKELNIQEHKEVFELKSKFEKQITQLENDLRDEQLKTSELEKKQAETAKLYQEEQQKAIELRSYFESELLRKHDLLQEEGHRRKLMEDKNSELLASKEAECNRNMDLIKKLEEDLANVTQRLNEEEQRNIELESSKPESHHVNEEIEQYIQKIQNLTEYSESLESKVHQLQKYLDEKSKNDDMQASVVQEMKEKCDHFQTEVNEQRQKVLILTESLVNVKNETSVLSNLLAEEKLKNEELRLEWERKAENLTAEINYLNQDIVEKTQQLQYLSGIESEVMRLKNSLALESERVQELSSWKLKAIGLEEELKSLIEGTKQIIPLSEISDDLEKRTNPEAILKQEIRQEQLCPTNSVSESSFQQRIMQLETEVENLKESLDQSYWSQSEKEAVLIAMEKAGTEQKSMFEKLENEVSRLKKENEELKIFKEQHLQNGIKSLSEDNTLSSSGEQQEQLCTEIVDQNQRSKLQDIGLYNGVEIENDPDFVSKLKIEIDSLKKALADQEERHTEMNLKMYMKGQEAAKFERKDQLLEMAVQAPEKVCIPELLSQLAETEKELEKVKDNQLENMPKSSLSLLSASEAVCLYLLGSFKAMYRQIAEGQANSSSSPEATLLFLKSAFYYFLTDEANCQGHLHAIQSILGFTEAEKQSIDTLTYIRR